MNQPHQSWSRTKTFTAVGLGATTLLVCGAAAVFALSGEDAEEAKGGFCDSLTEFSTTVQEYESLDPAAATNDEIDDAYDDIESSWDNVLEQGNDWVNAYDNELTDAYWDLYYAVDDLPGDNTMSENIEDLDDELSAFPSAFEATFDGTGCSDA